MQDIVIGAPAWGENICPECGKKEKRYYMGSWDWEPEVCVECKVKKLERDLEVMWREKYYDKVQEIKLAEEKLDVLEDCVAEMIDALEFLDQPLCERIIDRCGYRPEDESKESLVQSMNALSDENAKSLEVVRNTLTSVTKKLEALEVDNG